MNTKTKQQTRLKVAVTVACAAVLALGAVMAALTSVDTATNKFELAEKLEIKVVEPQWEAADDTDGDGVPDMAEGILPTQNIIKDPAIQNTTGVSAYIFADVTVPVRNVVTQNADGTYNEAAATQLFTYTVNEGWTLVETIEGDGCITYKYMYATPIANDTTATVFDSVTYANVADDSITGAELLKEIIINGYAIQEEGFDTVENAYNQAYPQETYAALYGNTLVLGEASEIPTAYNGIALTKAYDSGSTIETASYTSSNLPEWNADADTITSVAVVDEIHPASLAYFFYDLNNLASADVSKIDTSNVTNMQSVFQCCWGLETLDLSNWDTSNVTNMVSVFDMSNDDGNSGNNSHLTSIDLSGWDTSSVTNMYGMFGDCEKLTTIIGVENFNTVNVTNMYMMFALCLSLNLPDVSSFNTSNVTNMSGMFYCCWKIESLNLSGWDTSKVTDMSYMFGMFKGSTETGANSKLTTVDLSNWDTSKVTTMYAMFDDCESLETIVGVENFNTINVTSMGCLFDCCWSFTTLDLSGWDTSNVTDMFGMFNMYNSPAGSHGCSKLTTLNLSGWNTAKVTNMRQMFRDCGVLTTIYVGDSWNINAVTNSSEMFTYCYALVGGNGSTYSSSYVTKTYARADKPNQKGYFTQYYWITGSISNGNVTNNQQGITPGGSSEEMVFTPAEGYTISSIKVNNTSQTVSDTSSYTYPAQSNVNTYAHVVVTTQGVTYNVTYNANGGEGDDVTNTATYGSSYTIIDNTFTKTGYSFAGWNTEPDGMGTDYAAGTTAYGLCSTSGGTVTLYAKWNPITYYVVYDGNGGANGEITSVSQSCLYDTTYQISDCLFVNDGYTFAGWNTEPDGMGTDYAVGTDISNLYTISGESLTLYAQWNACPTYAALYDNTLVLGKADAVPETYNGVALTKTYDSGSTIENTSYSYNSMPEWNADADTITSAVVVNRLEATNYSLNCLFCGLESLETVDVAKIDTSSVTSLRSTFEDCYSLTSINGIENWDTSNVTTISAMLYGCTSLTNIDITNWTLNNTVNMSLAFAGCESLESFGDISGWNTSNVTTMNRLFCDCSSLSELDLSSWQTDNVTNMEYMFSDCISLTTIGDISTWNTKALTGSLDAMFFSCCSLTEVDLGNLYTDNVTSMAAMFSACESLTSVGDFANWNTSKVTDIRYMFNGCSSLTTLNLSNFKTGNVTYMNWMFTDCGSLEAIGNLVNWDTSKVKDMQNMFYGCFALYEVGDISGWVTTNVTAMDGMFCDCELLVADCSGWDTTNVADYEIFNDNADGVSAPTWVN